MRKLKASLVIFDLDGTLLNSVFDIATSVNAMRRHMNLPELPLELIYTFIGDGAHTLVQRSLPPEIGANQLKQALAYFLDHYRAHMFDTTMVFPGVIETLDGLRGKTLAILTNKLTQLTETLLGGLGLLGYFPYVFGGDRFPRKKPDPVGVVYLLEATGARPFEALLVGDTANDIGAGRNAGVFTCGVTFGLGGAKLRAAQPDYLIDDMRQLLKIVE